MTEALRRTGLLLPAAAGWLAVLLGVAAPAVAPLALAVAGPLAVAAVAVVARRRAAARPLVAATVVVVVLLLGRVVAGETARHPPAVPTGRPAAVEVRVESAATGSTGRSGLIVRGRLTAITDDAARVAVDTSVVLFAEGAAPVPGAVVAGRVVLRRAPPTDDAAYLGSVRGRLSVVAAPPPADRLAGVLRATFRRTTAALPGDGGALLPGLAIGDTSRVEATLTQAMRDSSLSHLTAVSGANCAVVMVSILWLAGRLRLRRGSRVVLAGLALAGFVLLVGPQPSVQRAAVMAALALGCVLGSRRSAGVPLLSLTVIVLLLLDPWLAWSAGFVLSVLATAGLLLLAPPLAARIEPRLGSRVALLLAVPIAAQAACQPVLLLLQPGLPVFGVVANLLAEPVAAAVTVLGLLACLAGPVSPPLAGGLALLAWLPSSWIGVVARTVAGLPQLDWLPGAAGAAVAAVALVAALVALRRRSRPAVRAVAASCVLVGVLLLVGTAIGGTVARRVGTPRDWVLAACDVGQGDGLVLNGRGRYAVIDTGREPAPILACLDRLGVRRIDLLVLTHWDLDHVGGAPALAARVGTALVGPPDGPAAVRLTARLRSAGAAVVRARRGDSVRLGALVLHVLWPPDPLGAVEPGNAACVTIEVDGAPSLLLTGDLGEQSEDAILAAGPLPRVDVVKVAHHGSADQSPGFYAAAGASLGVISVGAANDYGHPTRRLLAILRATGTLPVRTDEDGLVLIGARHGRLWLWTEHPLTSAVWRPGVR